MTTKDDRSPVFLTDTRTFRGVVYTLKELSAEDFEKLNEKATIEETVEVNGDQRKIERVDGNLQFNLMIRECVTPQPPRPIPLRLFNGFREALNTMHFSDEPDETPKDVKKDVKKDDEEEGPEKNG